jgi:hypothetical protein
MTVPCGLARQRGRSCSRVKRHGWRSGMGFVPGRVVATPATRKIGYPQTTRSRPALSLPSNQTASGCGTALIPWAYEGSPRPTVRTACRGNESVSTEALAPWLTDREGFPGRWGRRHRRLGIERFHTDCLGVKGCRPGVWDPLRSEETLEVTCTNGLTFLPNYHYFTSGTFGVVRLAARFGLGCAQEGS